MADTDQHAVLKQPAGTLQYMAPEQAQTSVPDIRNDIYSLGLIISQMQLGRRYKKIVQRCLMPIEQRYQSVEELQADIRSKDKQRPIFIKLSLLSLVTALLSVIAFQAWRLQRTADLGPTQADVDSLRKTMAFQKQLSREELLQVKQQMSSTMTLLSDSLQHMASDNKELQHQLHRVEEAKKEALQALRAQIKASSLDRHLDTLSRWSYRWPDLSQRIMKVNRFIYDYTDKLPASFSMQERDQIMESMLNVWQVWNRKVCDRAQSVRVKVNRQFSDSSKIHRNKIPKDRL